MINQVGLQYSAKIKLPTELKHRNCEILHNKYALEKPELHILINVVGPPK